MEDLIKLLGLGPEFAEGLGGLKVDKIDYYKPDNLITIRIKGEVTNEQRRLLEEVRAGMEKKSRCEVRFILDEPSKSVQPGISPEILMLLEEEENARKQKAEAKKKEKAAEQKNSWVAKAKEAKEQSSNDGGKGRFIPRKNSESLMGRVKSGSPKIDIKDLDDLSQDVNIEGYFVLMDDQKMADILKLNKAGTCVIAKFFIVDSTGGTNALMFLKPEEADIFEKKFAKGGYAGFQVSVNYDRGERGVKVSGIYEADPPPARRENCEYHRVELHVHSKMSEKDAISNPDDIMKLAASFGHRACAITDHGVVQGFPDAVGAVKDINKKKGED